MGSIGMPEVIIILVIALIIFGAAKLPQIGENMGRAIRNFKSATEREDRFDLQRSRRNLWKEVKRPKGLSRIKTAK